MTAPTQKQAATEEDVNTSPNEPYSLVPKIDFVATFEDIDNKLQAIAKYIDAYDQRLDAIEDAIERMGYNVGVALEGHRHSPTGEAMFPQPKEDEDKKP